MTKTEKVLAAFKAGEKLTAKQIESRFNVGNARATVSALRFQGFAIYANPTTNMRGARGVRWGPFGASTYSGSASAPGRKRGGDQWLSKHN